MGRREKRLKGMGRRVGVLRKSTHGYCFLFKHVKFVHTTVNTSTNTCMYYEITNNTHMLLPWLPLSRRGSVG